MITINLLRKTIVLLLILVVPPVFGQQLATRWSADGNSYYKIEQNEIVQFTLPANTRTVLVSAKQLTPENETKPLVVNHYSFSSDNRKVLIYSNATRVWRINTRG